MPVKKTATPKTTLVTQVTEEPTLQITQEPTLQVTQEPTLQVTQKLKTPTKYNKTVGAHVSNSSYSSTKNMLNILILINKNNHPMGMTLVRQRQVGHYYLNHLIILRLIQQC